MNSHKVARGLVLEVPFSEKDEAKQLGARWDPDLRKWFVPRGKDTTLFKRWMRDETASNPQTNQP